MRSFLVDYPSNYFKAKWFHVLYFIVLYCIVLYCIVLYCILLNSVESYFALVGSFFPQQIFFSEMYSDFYSILFSLWAFYETFSKFSVNFVKLSQLLRFKPFYFFHSFHDFRDLSDWQGAYQIYNTVKVRTYFHLSFALLLQFCLFYVLNLLFNDLLYELYFILNLMKYFRSPSLHFFSELRDVFILTEIFL